MSIIVPAILELTTDALIEQIKRVERELPTVPYVHIDIMDGSFVKHKSEIDPEELELLSTRLKFEVHFMTIKPERVVWEWAEIPGVFRVIRHMEAMGSISEFFGEVSSCELESGIAFNPLTDYSDTDYRTFDFVNQGVPDLIQFMTVFPGDQGAPLVKSVIDKMKVYQEYQKNKLVYKDSRKSPLISVDGAINKETIGLFKDLKVDIFNVGSDLLRAADMAAEYHELQNLIKNY